MSFVLKRHGKMNHPVWSSKWTVGLIRLMLINRLMKPCLLLTQLCVEMQRRRHTTECHLLESTARRDPVRGLVISSCGVLCLRSLLVLVLVLVVDS